MSPISPLDIYKDSYEKNSKGNGGIYSALLQISREFTVRRVLYPGSYVDITPSLFFPHVVYVDALSGIADLMADSILQEHIAQNKLYQEKADIRCYQQDYHTFNAEPDETFDLLISLNAGLVSQACKQFIDSGGLLLANDEHYDARRAFVDSDYLLVGAFNRENRNVTTFESELSSYFKTASGVTLTLAMVESDLSKPPSRARFRPSESAAMFLFKKQR